jgi:hypothetical protein
VVKDDHVSRCGGLTAACLALLAASVALATPGLATAAGATARNAICAATRDAPQPAAPVAGSPCWVEIQPYPFGVDGEPVDPTKPPCIGLLGPPDVSASCYLTVTSLAFRAWNRGLAATVASAPGNPFRVWLYNGSRWFPDPTFPGTGVCGGTTVFWAGKLDYWLVGGFASRICRFDGSAFSWEPLTLPALTLARITRGDGTLLPGRFHGGACSAWNDCEIFGDDGVRLHWDGTQLSDDSSDPQKPWLGAAVTAAVSEPGPAGAEVGLAVTASGATPGAPSPTAAAPDGSTPWQTLSLAAGLWLPLPFDLSSLAVPGDPAPVDLAAVDLGLDGRGWVAGNPAGREVGAREPAPVLPIALDGTSGGCSGPPAGVLSFRSEPAATTSDDYVWSSLAVLQPSGDQAFVGGSARLVPRGTPVRNQDPVSEPVIVHVRCDGSYDVTAFGVHDPTITLGHCSTPCIGPLVPADRTGSVSALAASAANAGWAATTLGTLVVRENAGHAGQVLVEPPRLYQWTDGQPPAAPAGDDVEARALPAVDDQPAPTPPAPVAPEPVVAAVRTIRLPPNVYWLSLHLDRTTFKLSLSFSQRHRIRIGFEALRGKRVVATTRLHGFNHGRHTLSVRLVRSRWPNRLQLITGSPNG